MSWDYEDEFESREDARKEREIAINKQDKQTKKTQEQLEFEAELLMEREMMKWER